MCDDRSLTPFLQRVLSYGVSDIIGEDDDNCSIIHKLLKSFLEDNSEGHLILKLNIAAYLEVEAQNILTTVADVELVFATFKNVFLQSHGEDSALLHGQCLISMTTILVRVLRKMNSDELSELFCNHMKFLLNIIQCDDGTSCPYIRSVVANCLTEIELSFPGILERCMETIYTATVAETSIAHQQLMCLLVLILKHSLVKDDSINQLVTDAESLKTAVSFASRETVQTSVPLSDLNQIFSFLVDQLHLCTEEGSFWICVHLIEILRSQSDKCGSAQVLKPLVLHNVKMYSPQSLNVVLLLDKHLGSGLFENEDQKNLLNTMVISATHHAIPENQRLLYFSWLFEYLMYRPEKVANIRNLKALLPNYFDSPKIQSKKLVTLSRLLKNKSGSTYVLLSALVYLQKQLRNKSSVGPKAAYSVVLYSYLCDHLNTDVAERIPQLILTATVDDISFIPFALNIVRCIHEHYPESNVSNTIMKTLIEAFVQPNSGANIDNFHHVLAMFLFYVNEFKKTCQPKVILSYLRKNVVCEEVCRQLPWCLGHEILSFCHYVMKEYETSPIFHELCDIFKSFISYNEDIDLQDRAHMFHSLLLCLSEKKLKDLLNVPKEKLTDLPTSAFSSRFTVRHLNRPVLKLRKHAQNMFTVNEQCELEEDMIENVLECYLKFISSESFPKSLKLQFSLSFIEDAEEEIQFLQALSLSVEVPYSWGKVNTILIGHFEKNKNNDDLIDVECFPIKSYPVTLHINAEFSLQDQCCFCQLEPYKLRIDDFFHSLPVPEVHITHPILWRRKLFSDLWYSFEEKSRMRNPSTHMSVYVSRCSKEIIRNKLQQFIVEDSQDDFTTNVGIFLPPDNHVLFKVSFKESHTIFRIATDDVLMLAHINDYFKDWS